MQTLPFTLFDDDPLKPAIGLVVLQSDETMEHEMRRWLPDHYRLFHTRIPNSQEISEKSLCEMKARLPQCVSLLPSNTNFRVIAYGCTSASTVIGEQAVSDAIHSVIPECAITNPVTAIVAQLSHICAKRIALLTPYTPEVTKPIHTLLTSEGFDIVHLATFNEPMDERVARISPQSISDAICQLGAQQDIDALVTSCTNLRTFSLINHMSKKIACPVISSNSAMAWHIQLLASA